MFSITSAILAAVFFVVLVVAIRLSPNVIIHHSDRGKRRKARRGRKPGEPGKEGFDATR